MSIIEKLGIEKGYYQTKPSVLSMSGAARYDQREAVFVDSLGMKRIKDTALEMLETLIENMTTYDVLKELFEKENNNIWQMIKGAYLLTPDNTKKTILKATGKSWEEIKEIYNV